MGNPAALRLLRSLRPSICASCRSRLQTQSASSLRLFSNTAPVAAERGFMDPMSALNSIDANFQRPGNPYQSLIPDQDPMKAPNLTPKEWEEENRHHLHVYATKHNTHITLTKPNRDALISVSCGNIGFRKAGRGTYDAAYQLAAFVMSRIQDKGLLTQIQSLEVIYRGFGPGREAVTKTILGSEGRNIRGKITRLTDSTRLKFGGTRSPAPRRLG